jgi:WD40 repeat protein
VSIILNATPTVGIILNATPTVGIILNATPTVSIILNATPTVSIILNATPTVSIILTSAAAPSVQAVLVPPHPVSSVRSVSHPPRAPLTHSQGAAHCLHLTLSSSTSLMRVRSARTRAHVATLQVLCVFSTGRGDLCPNGVSIQPLPLKARAQLEQLHFHAPPQVMLKHSRVGTGLGGARRAGRLARWGALLLQHALTSTTSLVSSHVAEVPLDVAAGSRPSGGDDSDTIVHQTLVPGQGVPGKGLRFVADSIPDVIRNINELDHLNWHRQTAMSDQAASSSGFKDRLQEKRERLKALRERRAQSKDASEPVARAAEPPVPPATPDRPALADRASKLVEEELAKPPPGTPEQGDQWVPQATRDVIGARAIEHRRQAIHDACTIHIGSTSESIRPSEVYSVGVQTDPMPELVRTPARTPPAEATSPRSLTDEEDEPGSPAEATNYAEDAVSGSSAALDKAMSRSEFSSFLNRSATAMTRLLSLGSKEWDILAFLGEGKADMTPPTSALTPIRALGEDSSASIEEDGWLPGEGGVAVAAMDCSQLNAHLLATSYVSVGPSDGAAKRSVGATVFGSARSGSDRDGVVAVWNLQSLSRPETVLLTESPVTCLQWHPSSNGILLGGCHSGRIVAWDTRTGIPHPVVSSTVGTESHTGPIFNLTMQATTGSVTMLTASADGQVCSWADPLRLSLPTHAAPLKHGPTSTSAVTMSSLSPIPEDASSFVVGSMDGGVYLASITGKETVTEASLQGHAGAVTSVRHPPKSSELGTDVVLTSSMDWTVKLWAPSTSTLPLFTITGSSDFVLDAAWNPAVTSVVASGDGEGRVSLWNIGGDPEEPLVSVRQTARGSVNRVLWAQDGRLLLAGDTCGNVGMYSVSHDVLSSCGVSRGHLDDLISQSVFMSDSESSP